MADQWRCPVCGLHVIWQHTLEERRACEAVRARRYKAYYQARDARKRQPASRVHVRLDNGRVVWMTEAQFNQQVGNRKGIEGVHLRRAGHYWTSEEAREAAKRCKRYPRSHRRIQRANRARYVSHRKLREQYSNGGPIHYRPESNTWVRWVRTGEDGAGYWHQLSERAALMRLGHLRKWYRRTTAVPVEIVQRWGRRKR